ALFATVTPLFPGTKLAIVLFALLALDLLVAPVAQVAPLALNAQLATVFLTLLAPDPPVAPIAQVALLATSAQLATVSFALLALDFPVALVAQVSLLAAPVFPLASIALLALVDLLAPHAPQQIFGQTKQLSFLVADRLLLKPPQQLQPNSPALHLQIVPND
ncbi:hypothetical protein MMC29_004534, partial [Sticta canariensis]|nr:hypothetical protein [Sticta canariensis]